MTLCDLLDYVSLNRFACIAPVEVWLWSGKVANVSPASVQAVWRHGYSLVDRGEGVIIRIKILNVPL